MSRAGYHTDDWTDSRATCMRTAGVARKPTASSLTSPFNIIARTHTMSKLCLTCSALGIKPEDASTIENHDSIVLHDTFFQNLGGRIDAPRETASRRPCHLCTLLLWSLDHAVKGSGELPTGPFRLELILGEKPSLSISCSNVRGCPLPISFEDSEEIYDAEVGLTADSHQVFATIESWVKECEGHQQCRSSMDPLLPISAESWLPTRVIDVGDANQAPKLCETSGLFDRYITLSHRWTDSTANSSTTLSNFEKRKISIDVSELSLTFQDAISATQRLGVQYLWIDSLCIIQDLQEDWARESQNMMAIYELAWLNISAVGSDDQHGRLFMPRNLIMHRAQALPGGLRTLTKIPKAGTGRPWIRISPEMAARATLDSFMDRRGWILQERTLSRRTVYFGKDEIFWECSSLIASERIPWGFSEDAGLSNLKFNSHNGVPRLGNNAEKMVRSYPSDSPADDHGDTLYYASKNLPYYTYWLKLVENFSAKDLTRPSDKLPAISGVAQALHKSRLSGETFDVAYSQGLWREDVAHSLLWYPINGEHHDIPDVCSYSWASCSGPVKFVSSTVTAYSDSTMGMRVRSLADASVFSLPTCEGGPLHIRGQVKRGYLMKNAAPEGYRWTLVFNNRAVPDRQGRIIQLDDFRRSKMDALRRGTYLNIACLKLVLTHGVKNLRPRELGLILRPRSLDGPNDAYSRECTRIGIYESPAWGGEKEVLDLY
ncbi:uncharacterized protein PAC_01303 [Phialocephala subalpina]|uniref:Heterokaryon incompatibility domain-containing protein n=1 Tax=Phialocephala subalpina TaxID=576137 RepID=A0A1L7WF74_9HELO|nr:uncharacterized protein PAC_01303 [Phialocephala subalpina]